MISYMFSYKRAARAEERIEAWGEEVGRHAEKWGEQFGKQMEDGCFWIPRVGVIFGLIIGVIIILAGLQLLFGWNVEAFIRAFGSLATIIIGSVFIIVAILLLSRRKR